VPVYGGADGLAEGGASSGLFGHRGAAPMWEVLPCLAVRDVPSVVAAWEASWHQKHPRAQQDPLGHEDGIKTLILFRLWVINIKAIKHGPDPLADCWAPRSGW